MLYRYDRHSLHFGAFNLRIITAVSNRISTLHNNINDITPVLYLKVLIEIFIILQAGGMYFNYKHSSLIRKRQSEILEELSNYWFVSE